MAGIFAILVLLTLFFIILSIPVGFYTLFATSLSKSYTYATNVDLFLFIGPFGFYLPGSQNIGILFVVFTAIYAAMIALAAFQGRSIFEAINGSFTEGVSAVFSNYLLVTVIAVGFLTFTASVVDIFVESAGVGIGSLSGDTLILFMSLVVAPLREEVGFRLILIGLPALILAIGLPARSYLKVLWRPSAAVDKEGWDLTSKVLIVTTIGISSAIWALAHVYSGSGWEWGKFYEVAYAGVVLGYLYVRYGLHIAVLTHWAFDYGSSVFAFFGQGAFGIPWTSSSGYILQNVYLFDAFYLIGISSFLVVIYVGWQGFAARKAKGEQAML